MIEKTLGRPSQAVQAEPSPRAPHAALLVDFDNVTMGIRSDLQTQLRKLLNSDIIRGKVSVQRAYADWRRYPQYIVPLTEASIDLIFAPAVGANKKNATDIRLAIDALELVFTRPEIGTFILLSGDSDFSALVLKLKEYGKFVIGVGIRESSSDLLVQNCDEYYSYNELTGLARTGEEEIVRRDPWELAVEAVQKMLESGDVMRSDRLKQVMQSIDPNFDEKDAGCNRFSKFVVEAEKRGLLRLTKMENGQYAVDVGSNANVPVDTQEKPKAKPGGTVDTDSSSRQKRSPRSRAEPEPKVRTLTLSESFDLLKRALVAQGAVGTEATVADRARDGMIEIHGNESDPVFDVKRFQRMLRQAHDADVIELIKSEGDDYMLKLSATTVAAMERVKPEANAKAATAEVRETGADSSKDAAAADAPKATTKRKTTKRKTTERKSAAAKSSRSRARAAAKDSAEDEADAAEVEAAPVSTEAGAKATAVVNPRFRRGSRSAKPRPVPEESQAESGAQPAEPPPAPPTPSPKASTERRTLGIRSGRRRSRHTAKLTAEEEQAAKILDELAVAEPETKATEPEDVAETAAAAPEPPAVQEDDGAGLFRKVTAAFQRAMGTVKEESKE